jgi:hypothetical protein
MSRRIDEMEMEVEDGNGGRGCKVRKEGIVEGHRI